MSACKCGFRHAHVQHVCSFQKPYSPKVSTKRCRCGTSLANVQHECPFKVDPRPESKASKEAWAPIENAPSVVRASSGQGDGSECRTCGPDTGAIHPCSKQCLTDSGFQAEDFPHFVAECLLKKRSWEPLSRKSEEVEP